MARLGVATLWATLWVALWAAGWLMWPGVVSATFYEWTTPDGSVGLTDDPGRIPPKYRATAKPVTPGDVPLSTVKPSANPVQSPSSPSDSGAGQSGSSIPHFDHNGHDKAWWQARVQELKDQRTELADQRKQLENKSNEVWYFGNQSAGARQEAYQLKQQADDLKNQIDNIDHQLSVDLPNEARLAGAPPGWLRD
ncbi:MAG TPA: hypothetical protein VEI24_01950 [Nitrospiria bacterium]|nr:hypothetical protein [Nitrospiria bacterium]